MLANKKDLIGNEMSNLQDVTYCGLYCRLCSTKSRLPQTAATLRDVLALDGWPDFGEQIMPDFNIFWSTLNRFAEFDTTCPDCRGGCGDPGCQIRICAKKRKIDICPFCDTYPCQHIQGLAQRYPNLLSDGARMKQIGVEAWIAEQEERCKTGFCYCDIRFPQKIGAGQGG